MTVKPRILIAGAGIGGLTAALALLRLGFDVEVHEQASELGEVGAGLQLSANATRVLHELGIGDAVRDTACEPDGKEIRLWNSGQTWKLFDLGASSIERYGYPYLTIYRPDLHKALVDGVRALDPSAIRLNAKCVDCRQDGDRVALKFADGGEAAGDALIGADGVHSVIRSILFGAEQAKFSGIIAWRGVFPMSRLPERMRRPVGVNWVGPGAHVINYPLRGGELFNFAGYTEGHDWSVESWSTRGSAEECAADFRGWNDDIQTMIGNLDQPYKWAVLVREPLSDWSVGRITLLGDACHATVPFLAQGAAMAIEDGLVLARCLERYGDDVATALLRYQSARAKRTETIVRQSTAMVDRFHNQTLSRADEAEKYVNEQWSVERIESRYNWLFEYNACDVAI